MDVIDWRCSNCGGANISPGSIQAGIGGGPIGFCYDCAPKRTTLPAATDGSAKAAASRARILREASTKPFRTRLTPLVEAAAYRPRVKHEDAATAPMFGDE